MNKEHVDFTVGDKVTLSLTDDRNGIKTTYLGRVREALGHDDYLVEVVLDNGHSFARTSPNYTGARLGERGTYAH
jgi:hypothetical protein